MKDIEATTAERRVAAIAAHAREDVAPAFDVSQAVLRRLRAVRTEYTPERSMMWMTAGAIAVAAVVMVLSMPYLDSALDPLTVFLQEAAASAI